ncbi:hypothetical protein T05_17 [Trichinella murrelli]|uniref:Uncharacterized protein n=1 Tax=Trichinella murrelli TaxID=144512 RepID=A0A0V0TLH9_9BILA|nr:hypothetical protein T05_17 [Trichinella murrelli]
MKSFRKIKNKEQNEDFIWNATEFEQRAKRVGLHACLYAKGSYWLGSFLEDNHDAICLNLFKNAPAVAYNTARIISQAAHSILVITIIFDKIIFSPCFDIINFCLVIYFYFNLKAKRLMRHCMTMCKQPIGEEAAAYAYIYSNVRVFAVLLAVIASLDVSDCAMCNLASYFCVICVVVSK